MNGVPLSFDFSKTLNEQLPTFKYYENMYVANEMQLYNLIFQKKQLIKFLKDKIDHLEAIIYKSKIKPYGEELRLLENSLNRYKEILDFVKKLSRNPRFY